ncbi:hypothetical protein [Streptomyces sp. NPDC093109]|uniref:hypothetical protein n=1 Tax=Streptomyces sp. NPDC093109 TaxID=3154977 RepID=UPI003450C0FA
MAATVVSVLVLTSCSSDEFEGWPSAAEAKAEYVKHSQTLTLAPDSEWPTDTVGMLGVEEPDAKKDDKDFRVRIAPGGGQALADEYWLCTWERHVLKDGLPKNEQSAALKEVAKFREADTYKKEKKRRERFDGVFKKAEEGEYEDMREEFKDFCADVPK